MYENEKVYCIFFDLEKAYDKLNWLELYKFCYNDSVENWLLDAVRAI